MKKVAVFALVLAMTGCSASLPMPYSGSGAQARRPAVLVPSGSDPVPAGVAEFTPSPPLGTYEQPDRQTSLITSAMPMSGPKKGNGEDRASFERQQVRWYECDNRECADIAAPLDASEPGQYTISIRMARVKATKSPFLGVLVMNPGGPGDPGTRMLEQSWPGLANYDLIAWDVRGTGNSTPLLCRDKDSGDDPARALMDADQSPDTPEEMTALLEGWKQFGARCAKSAGPYLRYLATRYTADDMDLMRALLRQDKLNYLGFSYGTYLGAWYAHRYPDRVGRMVLDAPVDISHDDALDHAVGFQRAIEIWADKAARDGRLGRTRNDVLTWLHQWLESLDDHPIAGSSRTISQSTVVSVITHALYSPVVTSLTDMLVKARDGDLSGLEKALEGKRTDSKFSSAFYSYYAIQCADRSDRGAQDAIVRWQETMRRAPVMGRYTGLTLHCAYWPVAAVEEPRLDAASVATPIMIVATTGDPATPFEYGRWMANELGNARVVALEGAGHTGYDQLSFCVDRTVERYLRDGVVPDETTVCRN